MATKEELQAQLVQAYADVAATQEPMLRVKTLEDQLAAINTQEQAALNISAIKAARLVFSAHMAELNEAQAAMDEACRVAHACYIQVRDLSSRLPILAATAGQERNFQPHHAISPLTNETMTRLGL